MGLSNYRHLGSGWENACSSNISGVTMLAVPADIYAYGFQIGLVLFIGVPVVILVVYFFLPTFYKLQYESSYEVALYI